MSEAEACGRYARNCAGVDDTISIHTDRTFTQEVTFTNGQMWSIKGSWTIVHQNIHLSKCYRTFDVEKQTVIIPPQTVYQYAFGLEKGNLVGSELEPPWVRMKGKQQE